MKRDRTKKIAFSAAMTAIAAGAMSAARFTPVGWVALLAVSGIATLLSARECGLGYGLLTYLATGLITLAVMPYNLVYVLVVGIHALLRDLLFGKNGKIIWRTVLGYAVLFAYFYAMSLACTVLISDLFGMGSFIAAVGGKFIFCLIAAACLTLYDFILSYLCRGILKAVGKNRKRKPPSGSKSESSPPQEDPFD